jgi:hypothetical protein
LAFALQAYFYASKFPPSLLFLLLPFTSIPHLELRINPLFAHSGTASSALDRKLSVPLRTVLNITDAQRLGPLAIRRQ